MGVDEDDRSRGYYGPFGGRYVAEALWTPLDELKVAFEGAIRDPAFVERYHSLLKTRLGRPTPLTRLERIGGPSKARLWLKREDLCAGGSFCSSLALGYALLAIRMGRSALVGDTATCDFGLALCAVGNTFGLDVRLFIGREDAKVEPDRVEQMRRMGARVVVVDTHHVGRKAACAEALRFWATHSSTHLYCSSSSAAAHPFPAISAYLLSIVGAETRLQLSKRGHGADFVVAPVGSGGFAVGLLSSFVEEGEGELIGVQAAGEGLDDRHAASLVAGKPGVFHGVRSFLLQDGQGQVLAPWSVASGLCVSHVAPQHAHWRERGWVNYVAVEDAAAVDAVQQMMLAEGITVSLEAGHAVAWALELLPKLGEGQDVVVGISGSGDRDVHRVAAYADSEVVA